MVFKEDQSSFTGELLEYVVLESLSKKLYMLELSYSSIEHLVHPGTFLKSRRNLASLGFTSQEKYVLRVNIIL